MPDKPNESKLMAMLERRGIVRKADSEDEPADNEPVAERPRPDADIRSILGQPAGDGPKVTPAPRQPVPGIINPIMPSAQPQTFSSAQPQPVKPSEPERTQPFRTSEPERPQPDKVQEPERTQYVKSPEPERMQPVRAPEPERMQPVRAPEPERTQIVKPPEPERLRFVKPPEPERIVPVEAPKPLPLSGGSGASVNEPFPVSDPFTLLVGPDAVEKPPEAPPENYTDRYLEVDDLYEALSIRSKKTDSIYLVEEYLNTLPDSLPDESRREIVAKIVTASGFDFDRLMGDGVLRVRMLKEYAERFAQYTEDYVAARNTELNELEQQIMRVRTLIEGRRELHKKQFFTIEAEAQRLKDILTFISG